MGESSASGGSSWQGRLDSPQKRLEDLFRTRRCSDLTITFSDSDVSFQVHRLVLAMTSPVFEGLLYGPKEGTDKLYLRHTSPDSFRWLLEYAYCGKRHFPTSSMALAVYHLADKYRMIALGHLCSQYLLSKCSPTNVPRFLDAAMTLTDTELIAKCNKVFVENPKEVLLSPHIGSLSRAGLRQLLGQKFALSSEAIHFNGLVAWGKEQTSEDSGLRGTIEEFLPGVRYLDMPVVDFVDNVIPSLVFTPEESNAILLNIRQFEGVPLPAICVGRPPVFKKRLLKRITFSVPAHTNPTPSMTASEGKIVTGMEVSKTVYIDSIQFRNDFPRSDSCTPKIVISLSSGHQLASEVLSGNEVKFSTPVQLTPKKSYDISTSGKVSSHFFPFNSDKNHVEFAGYALHDFGLVTISYWCLEDDEGDDD